jgi:putative oxidoreductase
MTSLVDAIERLHLFVFGALERVLEGWFPGLFARFAFAAVLLVYFLNSALTKIGEGAFGFLSPSIGAYYQIAPHVVEAAGGDVSQIAFFPWGLIVLAGTWAEIVLPILIVLGLFTRLAALGMIGFIAVQSFVDIFGHKVGPETIGRWFDRFQDSAIADQRLLWLVPLVYLVVKGAGAISLDAILARARGGELPAAG